MLVPLLLVAVTASPPGGGPGRARDRVVDAVDPARTVTVPGTLHPQARPELDAGRAPSGAWLEAASVVLGPSAEQQRELEALLADQQDPASPRHRRWLTPDEFADRFGATPSDVAQVSAWLSAQGLTVLGANRSRTRVAFSGTVGRIEAALRTELHHYQVGARRHLAPATALSVPAALAGVVAGFHNLTDFRARARHVLRRRAPVPAFTSSVTGNHFLAPDDFAAVYDLQPLYAAGVDGAGQRIAVIGQSAIDPRDTAAFRAASGLAALPPELLLVPSSGNDTVKSGDVDEANLDVQWTGAVARGATIVYVHTGDSATYDVSDALAYAVDHAVAPVISISYGYCEGDLGSASVSLLRRLAQQANAQGQTIAAASGDLGAADCEAQGATIATRGLAVDLPASLPEVTGVGGTEFVGDVASPSLYWAAANGAGNGSALGYIPEAVWNDSDTAGQIAATGGGASALFPKPSWQVGPGVPADGMRDVPDVALAASPFHDGYLTCSRGSCVSGYRAADGTLTVVGGTSAGAPAFAGVLALLNQAAGGGGLGNVNPRLYDLAAAVPAAFHRITQGDNAVPCRAGTPSCPTTGELRIGYAAGGAYAPGVGLGSIDGHQLVTAWASSAPAAAPGFDVAATPAVVAVAAGQGGSAALTVTATGGFTGTVALACAPPTTAPQLGCAVTPASVDVGAGTPGVAQIAITTATAPALAAGWAVLASAAALLASRRRRAARLAALLLAAGGVGLACGGGGGGPAARASGSVLPAGSYTVTVSASAGAISRVLAVPVEVR